MRRSFLIALRAVERRSISAPFVMEADQERRTLDRVREWLGRVDARGA
jgi:hypothetical protein